MTKYNFRETHKVVSIEHITESAFVINIERKGMAFFPGQYIVLGIKGGKEFRQYSIYGGINDEALSILIKEVDGGTVTPLLRNLKPDDEVEIEGAMGHFTIGKQQLANSSLVMIASGTGVAPFHSFINSYPDKSYTLIHGVQTAKEAYGKESYNPNSYVLCTSRDATGNFSGRVTNYLETQSFKEDTLFYLCGNSNMIFDAMEVLKAKGVSNSNMFAEIYF